MPPAGMEGSLRVLLERGGLGRGIISGGEAARFFHPPARGARNKRSRMREPGKKQLYVIYIFFFSPLTDLGKVVAFRLTL